MKTTIKSALALSAAALALHTTTLQADDQLTDSSLKWQDHNIDMSAEFDGSLKIYTLTSDATLRDSFPAGSQVRIWEKADKLYLRSGSTFIDGLFGLAVQEVQQNSVNYINDWAFTTYSCMCFETGKKWNYVWTRDTAYSAHLGLAHMDPLRAMNSLSFKLSGFRNNLGHGGEEIVQDTGSGGSWPVSSDRVVWALGAYEVLQALSEPQRSIFEQRMLSALKNTIENDRRAVYDSRDGLYKGEQSFLDWREQTYATYTAQNTAHIAMSKSLSTNVAHYYLLNTASKLAAKNGEAAVAKRYSQWAVELKAAINSELWLKDVGMYSAMTATELDGSALHKYDLLGMSLAILFDVADAKQAKSILDNYPHSRAGAPVIFPQQPFTAIYHNRAIWPFVSAYWVQAAKKANNPMVFWHNAMTLVRGAAINLSNMENFEFLTQQNWFDAGNDSGPVINSQRQLWSVAGYLSLFVDGIIGRTTSAKGIRFAPYLPGYLYEEMKLQGSTITLYNFNQRGKLIDITLHIPDNGVNTGEVLVLDTMQLNNTVVANSTEFNEDNLQDHNQLDLYLKNKSIASETSSMPSLRMINVIDANKLSFAEVKAWWAPKEPRLLNLRVLDKDVQVEYTSDGEKEISFNIYRNGTLVAEGLNKTLWTDRDAVTLEQTLCYTIETVYSGSNNRSHHSEPNCYWPKGSVSEYAVGNPELKSYPLASTASDHGRLHFNDWGWAHQTIVLEKVIPAASGNYYLQTTYGNAGPINTGITAASKLFEVWDTQLGKIVQQGVVTMPHLKDWDTWGDSTLVPVTLEKNKSYKIVLKDYMNMSYLKHFDAYKGRGGQEGAVNRANISAIKLLYMGEAKI